MHRDNVQRPVEANHRKRNRPTGVTDDFLLRERHMPHWQQGGRVYFITFRSRRGPLPEEALGIVVESIRFDHGRRYDLCCAVAMPDHVHLLIQPREKAAGVWYDLSEITKSIKGVSARRINRLLGTSGSVWQEESFDRIVRDERELLEKWNYIMTNPVRSALVTDSEGYRFLLTAEQL